LNDVQADDQIKLNVSEIHTFIANVFADLGETDAAFDQAEKAVSLARAVPAGNPLRSLEKVSRLSEAAFAIKKSGAAPRADRLVLQAQQIWQSLGAPHEMGNEWICGRWLIRALVEKGDVDGAKIVYSQLANTIPKDVSRDVIGVFGMAITVPLARLIDSGHADAALTLASSLDKPLLRADALASALEDLPKGDRCDLAPQIAEALVTADEKAEQGDDEFVLTRRATLAAECRLKDVSIAAIDRLLKKKAADGFGLLDYSQLAYAAARAGDPVKAKSLIGSARADLRDREKVTATQNSDGTTDDPEDAAAIAKDDCKFGFSAGGRVSRRASLVKAYAALGDYGAASDMADEMLAKTDGIKPEAARLACMAFTAETLLAAKMWKKAGNVSRSAFDALQKAGKIKGKEQDWPRRIANALGNVGEFGEADQALTFIADPNPDLTDDRKKLAVLAVRAGNMEAAEMFASAIPKGNTAYFFTRIEMAQIQAGLPPH
jgi:hypothetical protein